MGFSVAGTFADKVFKMKRCRTIAADGRQRGTQQLLVMFEKSLAEVGDGYRRERQQRRRVRGELRVDLRGDPFRLKFVCRNAAANLPGAIPVIHMPGAVVLVVGDAANPAAAGLALSSRSQGTH